MRSGREAVEYFFELSLYLFVLTGFVAVAATGKLDVPSVLLVGGALGVRGLAFLRLTRVSIHPDTVTRLTMAYMVFYALDLFLISGSFVTATGHLVFYLLVMKLFSAQSNRDFLYLALIAFMEMLLAAIMTINTTFLGLFAIFLLFGIATFTSFEMRRAYIAAEAGRVKPADPVGRDPQRMLRGLGVTTVLVTLGVLVTSSLLFFFIPRFTTGYLSSFAPKSQTVSGFSDNVQLGDLGEIKQSSMVVMHVKMNWIPPDLSKVRWRGVGLNSFDGKRWVNTTGSVILERYTTDSYFLQRGYEDPQRGPQNLRYSVLLEPISSAALFLAPTAVRVSGRFRMLELDGTDSVMRRDASFSAMRYDATSALATPEPDLLRTAAKIYPPEIRARFLQLPKLDERIPALAREITKNSANPYDKAAALELYLRTKLGYTLEQASGGPDPLADFLFNVRKGHCEYFSSAMTIMARTLGIPARVVNGFLTGEYNEVSQQFVVRGRDAHSWVEVYFPGYGWTSFDPTPSAGTLVAAGGFSNFSKWMDAARTFWTDWVVSYDFSRQFLLARQLDRGTRQATQDTRSYFRARYEAIRNRIKGWHQRLQQDPQVIPAVLVLAVVSMLLVVFRNRIVYLWRQSWSRSRVRSGRASPRDVTLVYQRLLDFLASRGVRRTPAMTARQVLAEVADPALIPVVAAFTEVYEEARFGGATARLPDLYALLGRLQTTDKHR